jgi:hypothetical protein
MKTYRESRCNSTLLWSWKVVGERHAPAALPLGKRPGTHLWMLTLYCEIGHGPPHVRFLFAITAATLQTDVCLARWRGRAAVKDFEEFHHSPTCPLPLPAQCYLWHERGARGFVMPFTPHYETTVTPFLLTVERERRPCSFCPSCYRNWTRFQTTNRKYYARVCKVRSARSILLHMRRSFYFTCEETSWCCNSKAD